jgi:integrase
VTSLRHPRAMSTRLCCEMTEIRLKRLTKDRSEGLDRYYVRLPGKRIVRIYGVPGSESFMTAYRAAITADQVSAKPDRPQPSWFAPGTVGRAIHDYLISRRFQALGNSRQRSRRLILMKITDTAGQMPVTSITKQVIELGMARRSATPSAANEFLKSLRAVFACLIESEQVKKDPTRQVAYNSIHTEGHHIWTLDEVSQFIDCHGMGSQPVLAMSLLLLTGQRRGDVIRMGPQHIKGGFISLRQRKTNNAVAVPVLSSLQCIINQSQIGNLNFLVTKFGRPYTDAGFGNKFRDWCDAAGPLHCSAHGLRKAGATIAADLGASDEELMSLFGWTTRKQVSVYTRGADRKRLATGAAEKIDRALKANRIVPLDTEVEPARDNSSKNTRSIKA